jgi:hypothetical protein
VRRLPVWPMAVWPALAGALVAVLLWRRSRPRPE